MMTLLLRVQPTMYSEWECRCDHEESREDQYEGAYERAEASLLLKLDQLVGWALGWVFHQLVGKLGCLREFWTGQNCLPRDRR